MSSRTRASQFIEESVQSFKSEFRTQSRVLDIAVAGHTIRIHVSSEPLWNVIYPALAFQARTSLVSDPEIEIFAVEGDGVINLPWNTGTGGDSVRIEGSWIEDVFATFSSDYSTLSMFDRSSSRGLFWVRSAKDLPEWEFGAPLRNILTWAFLDRGLHVVHAAGVGVADKGVMISGPGGAGKSTTTAICLQVGFQTTGDDYCVVSTSQPPQIYSLYGMMKLIPGALGTTSMVDVRLTEPRSDGKVHFDIASSMTTSLTITAILFTTVGVRTLEPVSLTYKEALLRLIPSTWAQTALPQKELLHSLSALAQSIRSFQLEVGPDSDRIPEIVSGL
jgi:hypothetical protein